MEAGNDQPGAGARDPGGGPQGPGPGSGSPGGEAEGAQAGAESAPSQDQLRRQLEEQLRQVRVQDLLLESVVSILNLSARRIAKPDERDLEQARVGIEAVRAVIELLEEGPRGQVTEALSQVQVLYAREARGGGESGGEGVAADEPGGGDQGAGHPDQAPPPPRRPSGLWTPPGT